MRRLGLDVGTVRIGVALSDPLGLTAQPIEVIERRRVDPRVRIAELIAEHEVSEIVVGLPLTLMGERGPAVDAVESFVENLREAVSIPIQMWDERLSTAEAQRAMINDGVRRDKRKKKIDKLAAALILQSYMEANPLE